MALSIKDLSPIDFISSKRTRIRFSKLDPKHLPLGSIAEFDWKDYCPAVFRHLQEFDKIDNDEYLLSVCGYETLKEISSPRKSGNMLYLPKDDRFVLKIVRKSEVKVLKEMLQNYYVHVRKYDTSLLTKFYGLHLVKPLGGPKVYFVVMENIFRSDLCIHKRYDLKGSSQGRTVSKFDARGSTTLKDLDLDFSFYLNPLLRHRLLVQIKCDCDFLESEGIMDYSLLIGVHIETPRRASFNGRSLSLKKTNSLERRNKNPEMTIADICKHPDRPGFKLGVRMPARAVKNPSSESGSVSLRKRVGIRESHDVLLYFGMIDILQVYNGLKRFEHAYKAIHYDSKSISTVNPKAYSTRLQDFLSQVFKSEDPDT